MRWRCLRDVKPLFGESGYPLHCRSALTLAVRAAANERAVRRRPPAATACEQGWWLTCSVWTTRSGRRSSGRDLVSASSRRYRTATAERIIWVRPLNGHRRLRRLVSAKPREGPPCLTLSAVIWACPRSTDVARVARNGHPCRGCGGCSRGRLSDPHADGRLHACRGTGPRQVLRQETFLLGHRDAGLRRMSFDDEGPFAGGGIERGARGVG